MQQKFGTVFVLPWLLFSFPFCHHSLANQFLRLLFVQPIIITFTVGLFCACFSLQAILSSMCKYIFCGHFMCLSLSLEVCPVELCNQLGFKGMLNFNTRRFQVKLFKLTSIDKETSTSSQFSLSKKSSDVKYCFDFNIQRYVRPRCLNKHKCTRVAMKARTRAPYM